MLLKNQYVPVDAEPKFRRRLLTDLRRRQQDLAVSRRLARRRAIGGFGFGALATTAAVFVFGVLPTLTAAYPVRNLRGGGIAAATDTPAFAPAKSVLPLPVVERGMVAGLSGNAARDDDAAYPRAAERLAPMPTLALPDWASVRAAPANGGLFMPAGFGLDGRNLSRPAAALSLPPAPTEWVSRRPRGAIIALDGAPLAWPAGRRGEMAEVVDLDFRPNAGSDWRRIERGMVKLADGAEFRTDADDQGCGIAFEDGTRVSLLPGSRMSLGSEGFRLERGSATMAVPAHAGALAWRCEERDLAIEPGTTAMLEVGDPGKFAPGGAPAPRLSVAGGLAFARGTGGVGALFPDRMYTLDHYVTADIPGRPLCQGEWSELADRAPVSIGGAALVSGAQPRWCPETHPAEARGYVRRDGKWVEPTYQPGMPVTTMAYLSAEHLNLLRTRRDLTDYLSLGPGVVFRDGDEFYEID